MESRSVLIVASRPPCCARPRRRNFAGREKPREWDVTLGAAVASRPSFEGSDRSIVRPLPFVAVRWRDTISLGEGGLSVTGHLKKFRFGGGLTVDAGRKDHSQRRDFRIRR